MSTATFPRIPAGRYRAVKEAVRIACTRLQLCDDAKEQCIDRAAKALRQGRTGANATAAGRELAKRLAGWRAAPTMPGGLA